MSSKNSSTNSSAKDESSPLPIAGGGEERQITGRAVFAVDTTSAGIVVRTAFLGEQGQLLDTPAVFPDLTYALNQIDHLRQIVIERFAQAAQVGIQVIAAQQQNANPPAPQDATPEVDPEPETQKI